MIKFWMKCGLLDYETKKTAKPDFFEIVWENGRGIAGLGSVFEEIRNGGIEFFIHLPTVLPEDDGSFRLLNVASFQDGVREKSRNAIESVLRDALPYRPSGFILHAPTANDFSTKEWAAGPDRETLWSDSFEWIRSLSANVMVENVPPCIRHLWTLHPTKPCGLKDLIGFQIPVVLDTWHLYAEIPHDGRYCAYVKSISEEIRYVHVASLLEKGPYDTHGKLFQREREEFPSQNVLVRTLETAFRSLSLSGKTGYFVCEPGWNSDSHVSNLASLRKEWERFSMAERARTER